MGFVSVALLVGGVSCWRGFEAERRVEGVGKERVASWPGEDREGRKERVAILFSLSLEKVNVQRIGGGLRHCVSAELGAAWRRGSSVPRGGGVSCRRRVLVDFVAVGFRAGGASCRRRVLVGFVTVEPRLRRCVAAGFRAGTACRWGFVLAPRGGWASCWWGFVLAGL
ncbi:MAG: hypothetical protein GX589_08680 [Deltaproteobacteria bacterium]|nr:hypothetical protein [Deltaproteobacteria bacterium]